MNESAGGSEVSTSGEESVRSRVLVIDGSRVVRMLIGNLLSRSLPEVEVIALETGDEALAHTDREHPAFRADHRGIWRCANAP